KTETNINFQIATFGTIDVMSVPIPPNAQVGDQYVIRVVAPSATSDGGQTSIGMVPLPDRIITVTNVPYLIGDCSPGSWYNAGDFGDGNLNNADVVTIWHASLGVNTPYNDLVNSQSPNT